MSKLNSQFKLLVLGFFLTFAATAFASDKQDVANTYQAWCSSLGTAKGNSADMVKYYAPDAILLATFSTKILMNINGGLDSYFKNLTSLKDLKCATDKLITQVYGDFAVNTGSYTFTYLENGKTKTVPARFTFVYGKQNNQWMIVNHHSSVVPANI